MPRPRDREPSVPIQLDLLTVEALAIQREARLPSASEFVRRLEACSQPGLSTGGLGQTAQQARTEQAETTPWTPGQLPAGSQERPSPGTCSDLKTELPVSVPDMGTRRTTAPAVFEEPSKRPRSARLRRYQQAQDSRPAWALLLPIGLAVIGVSLWALSGAANTTPKTRVAPSDTQVTSANDKQQVNDSPSRADPHSAPDAGATWPARGATEGQARVAGDSDDFQTSLPEGGWSVEDTVLVTTTLQRRRRSWVVDPAQPQAPVEEDWTLETTRISHVDRIEQVDDSGRPLLLDRYYQEVVFERDWRRAIGPSALPVTSKRRSILQGRRVRVIRRPSPHDYVDSIPDQYWQSGTFIRGLDTWEVPDPYAVLTSPLSGSVSGLRYDRDEANPWDSWEVPFRVVEMIAYLNGGESDCTWEAEVQTGATGRQRVSVRLESPGEVSPDGLVMLGEEQIDLLIQHTSPVRGTPPPPLAPPPECASCAGDGCSDCRGQGVVEIRPLSEVLDSPTELLHGDPNSPWQVQQTSRVTGNTSPQYARIYPPPTRVELVIDVQSYGSLADDSAKPTWWKVELLDERGFPLGADQEMFGYIESGDSTRTGEVWDFSTLTPGAAFILKLTSDSEPGNSIRLQLREQPEPPLGGNASGD